MWATRSQKTTSRSGVARATGNVFGDVSAGHPFARWIERIAAEGIIHGCAAIPPSGALYCPDAPLTRGQMAVFLGRVFNLPL